MVESSKKSPRRRSRVKDATKAGATPTEETKTASKKATTPSDASPRRFLGYFLCIATFVDTIVATASLPTLTLHSSTAAFTLQTLVFYQLIFFFPQLIGTLLAEWVAKRVTGTRAYAATLFATALSTYVTSMALHLSSLPLYLLARFLSGTLRHTNTLGALAELELPETWCRGDRRRALLWGLLSAMCLGGLLGDVAPSAAVAMETLAAVEFVNACAVLLIAQSAMDLRRAKTIPAQQSSSAYAKWLLQLPGAKWGHFVPTACVTLAAGVTQCMYPFVDRRVFGMRYTFIGLHLVAMMSTQLVAPLIVQRYGEKGMARLVPPYAVLLCLGAWIAAWAEKEEDAGLYIFTSVLLTDLPAAVLEVALGNTAAGGFSASEKPFAVKLTHHVKMFVKLWTPVWVTIAHGVFASLGREDGGRMLSCPAALAVLAFVYVRSAFASAVTAAFSFALLVLLPQVDSEEVWANMLAPIRAFVASTFAPHTE